MAERLGISFASVARIWRKWNIQPHRVETFEFSTDPQLEAKLRDVVGFYLTQPADGDDRADHPMMKDRRGMMRRPETTSMARRRRSDGPTSSRPRTHLRSLTMLNDRIRAPS